MGFEPTTPTLARLRTYHSTVSGYAKTLYNVSMLDRHRRRVYATITFQFLLSVVSWWYLDSGKRLGRGWQSERA